MFLRKLFWNLGGILPVWLVHPGQIILAIERKLGATLFKGVTLPAWWTPSTAPTLIFAAGCIMAFVFGIGGAIYTIQKFGDDFSVELLLTICAIGFGAGFVLLGSAALSTIWPWRHLRVAVCAVGDIGDKRAACKIARTPCTFLHTNGVGAQERYVHWFWGWTLGSRYWKFRFKTHAQAGDETTHSFLIVSDRTGQLMSFTIHEMTDVDSIYEWRGQCLYGAHHGVAMNWFDLLDGLFMRSSTKLTSAEMSVERHSDELRLARIESEAWIHFMRLLGEYFGNGRTTRPDKEIARLLGDASIVMAEHMGLVRRNGTPYSHDENALRERFAAMNWPPLVSARKKRAPGTVTAYAEPATDDSR